MVKKSRESLVWTIFYDFLWLILVLILVFLIIFIIWYVIFNKSSFIGSGSAAATTEPSTHHTPTHPTTHSPTNHHTNHHTNPTTNEPQPPAPPPPVPPGPSPSNPSLSGLDIFLWIILPLCGLLLLILLLYLVYGRLRGGSNPLEQVEREIGREKMFSSSSEVAPVEDIFAPIQAPSFLQLPEIGESDVLGRAPSSSATVTPEEIPYSTDVGRTGHDYGRAREDEQGNFLYEYSLGRKYKRPERVLYKPRRERSVTFNEVRNM